MEKRFGHRNDGILDRMFLEKKNGEKRSKHDFSHFSVVEESEVRDENYG